MLISIASMDRFMGMCSLGAQNTQHGYNYKP